jgi:hypothetical protein
MNFTMEKPAFMQNNSGLHAFPRYNPRKVLNLRELYPRKACLSADYPWKVKLRARISPQNSQKNINLLLGIHHGPFRCCLMNKNEIKKSHATVPLN